MPTLRLVEIQLDTQTATDREPLVPPLDATVTGRLRALVGRTRRYMFVEGVACVLGFLLAGAAVQFGFDYGTRGLRWSMRAALLAVVIVGGLWVLWRRVVTPLRHRFGIAEMAKLVERRHPALSSLLISAVRFAGGDVGSPETNSRELMDSVVSRAGREAAGLALDSILDKRRARRFGLMIVSVVLVGAGAAWASPDVMGLWFQRNVLLKDVDWPKRTHLFVELTGDQLIGARGDDLVVEARAEGVQPREVEIVYETKSGHRGRETMVTVGSADAYRYRYSFKNAQEDFTFYLEGGDDQTREYEAVLMERPQVTRTEMRITPPAYTQLAHFTLADGQRATQVLPGSTVTIWIETNKPVTKATLTTGRDEGVEAVRDGERYTASFTPTETHTYHFVLIDEVGLENRQPVRFSVRVVEDEAPRVRMNVVGAGAMITSEAVLPIELEFSDTYGLATSEVTYVLSRDDAKEEVVPLPDFRPRVTTFQTSLRWPVASVGVVAGEALTLAARASDFNDVTGPSRTETPGVTLRVVTREELLAELARREQEYRADFERLVDSQEQLRGGLLTAIRSFQAGSRGESLAAELAPLERRQRNIAGSVNVVRQQFERILTEMAVNQLDTLEARQRLGDGIIQPMTELSKRNLLTAADTIRQWSREATVEKAALIDPQQVEILSQMRSVLSKMIQWEGYQEVVGLLRDIIRLQQELRGETKSTLQEHGRDVFDD